MTYWLRQMLSGKASLRLIRTFKKPLMVMAT